MKFPHPFGNPELSRLARTMLPPRRAFLLIILTLAALGFAALLAWATADDSYNRAKGQVILNFTRRLLFLMSSGLVISLFIAAPAMTALAFVLEKLRGTAIFQQMSLLSPWRLVWGKYLGYGLFGYLLAALILPVYLVYCIPFAAESEKAVERLSALIIGGLCFQAVALFLSAIVAGTGEKPMRGGLLLSPLIGGAGLITAGFTLAFVGDLSNFHFYGYTIAPFTAIILIYLFLGVWAIIGTIRRVKETQLIPVSPHTVWLFWLTAELLLCGFLWGRANYYKDEINSPKSRLLIFILFNFVGLLVLAGVSALTRGRLREWWSATHDPMHIFRRREITDSLKTFVIAVALAECGIAVLWLSYHAGPYAKLLTTSIPFKLLPIMLGFWLCVAAVSAFVQFCAMFRFRWQGFSGVALAGLFYVAAAIGFGFLSDIVPNRTLAAINPAIFAGLVADKDAALDIAPRDIKRLEQLHSDQHDCFSNQFVITGSCVERFEGEKQQLIKSTTETDSREVMRRVATGFMAQSALALFCFGLAIFKWRRLRAETMIS